jgi:hypothetical protein
MLPGSVKYRQPNQTMTGFAAEGVRRACVNPERKVTTRLP